MTARLRMVLVEATEEMRHAGIAAEDVCDTSIGYVATIYNAMLAAAPQPTDAQVDELCGLMWRDTVSPPEHYSVTREQLNRMRAFIRTLNGQPPKGDD